MSPFTRNFLVGIFLVSCAPPVFAQGTDCVPDQNLSHAEAEFAAGHFYAIPAILQRCLQDNGFSQEQSVRAYLLLCQAYLVIDDPIAAEDSYLKLLKADPEFVPNDKDHPIDIVYLSKKFTATPIFTPHFRIGLNSSIFRSIYAVNTEPYPVPVQSSLQLGYQLGAGIDWNIDDNISLCAELDYASRSYKRIKDNIASNDVSSVIGNQSWVDFPIYFKYGHNPGRDVKLRPFGYVGFALNYLLSAKNEFIYTDNKPQGTQVVAEGPNEQVTYQRNLLNRSWLIGGGLKYKWGKDFLYVDLRYMGGLSNMAMQSEIYYQDAANVDKSQIGNPNYYLSNNITRYRYVSDLFRIDNISLSFGFVHPIYDPRKVKKAKTKGVARQIKKEEKENQK